MTRAAFLAVLLGCSSREPARSADEGCGAFLAHIDKLTKTPHKPPDAAALEYCRKHTDEQRRCTLAATTPAEYNLCSAFRNPTGRALGRKIQAAIMSAWPGTIDLPAHLAGQEGCAFIGLVGMEGFVFDESHAVVTFATRATPFVNATFTRDGEVWSCTQTDPPATCDSLARECKRP